MSVQSRQVLRLLKFVAELKKNSYPNASSFVKLLEKADTEEAATLPCRCRVSPRTIARDIETLKIDYNAPIEYDPVYRGYFLRDPEWELGVPIFDDELLSMAMLGTRLSSDILPEPVKGKADSAMDKVLSGNHSAFFDDAMIESILCATGIKSAVDPVVFKKIFDAWRLHQVVELTYHKPNAPESDRRFEPHILAFRNGVWYTKGHEYKTRAVKVYAIQRILGVKFADDTFVSDKKLIEETRKNGLFVYPKISGIRLRCDASIAFYLREHQHVKQFKVEPQDDGSLIITLLPAVEHEVIRWILGESGKVEVLYPPELRAKVAAAARVIWERNRKPAADAAETEAEPAAVKRRDSRSKTASARKTVAKAASAPRKKRSAGAKTVPARKSADSNRAKAIRR